MAATSKTAVTFIDEDFSDATGSTPPPGWTDDIIEGNPKTDKWRFDNPGDRSNTTITLPAPFAVYDSDAISNDGKPEDVALVTPTFDASKSKTVYLKFDQNYLVIPSGENASIGYVEAYNGSQWKPVATQVADVNGTTTLDLTKELAGVKDAQVRFRFDGNWSYLWAIDNVKVVDYLKPGVVLPTNLVGVSESNVPDPLHFTFTLNSRPTSNVTLNFQVDRSQLNPIKSLTFTPDNWYIPQTSTVSAVADGINEGENQKTNVKVSVSSNDSAYNGLKVDNVPVTITDSTIPGFTSYRTVEKTYSDLSKLAATNPNIASWIDIGDSYDKVTPGGRPGYDLYSIDITNKATNGKYKKPVLFIEGAIHAREYVTAESVTRFAEQLINQYGKDADITWLLDYVDIRLVPIVNPDGRKFAEQGYSWRKNTDPTVPKGVEPAKFPNYGVDLNRNYDSKWGEVEGGASTDPADDTYQGATPFSEPESQALRNYLLQSFPKQKGPGEFDRAPDDSSGVYLDIHSYGNLVLYPFGWTNQPAPNKDGLRQLGLKFGYFTQKVDGEAYDVQQSIGLYPTSGTTDDWVYQTFGSAAYTIEIGTDFFQDSDYFEKNVVPKILPAYLYAAKAARRPYQLSDGPDVTNVTADIGEDGKATLKVTADATRYADGNLSSDGITEGLDLPNLNDIKEVRYSIDAPSWIAGTSVYKLKPDDGKFDTTVEKATATIDISSLTPGRHTIFVESIDDKNNLGVPTAVFLNIPDPSADPSGSNSSDSDSVTGTSSSKQLLGSNGDSLLKSGADVAVQQAVQQSTTQLDQKEVSGGRSSDFSTHLSHAILSSWHRSAVTSSEAETLAKLGAVAGFGSVQ
jgi:hypothetical protein